MLCDWNKVLKRNRKNLIYIVGNPPFLGSKNKSFDKGQKESMAQAMPKAIDGVKLWSKSGDLDFVCAWRLLSCRIGLFAIVPTENKGCERIS